MPSRSVHDRNSRWRCGASPRRPGLRRRRGPRRTRRCNGTSPCSATRNRSASAAGFFVAAPAINCASTADSRPARTAASVAGSCLEPLRGTDRGAYLAGRDAESCVRPTSPHRARRCSFPQRAPRPSPTSRRRPAGSRRVRRPPAVPLPATTRPRRTRERSSPTICGRQRAKRTCVRIVNEGCDTNARPAHGHAGA